MSKPRLRLKHVPKPKGGFIAEVKVEGGPNYLRVNGWVDDEGVARITQVVVADHEGDVTATEWRNIKLGEIREAILTSMRRDREYSDFRLKGLRDGTIKPGDLLPGVAAEVAQLARQTVARTGREGRPGRPHLSDDKLLEIAFLYLHLAPTRPDVVAAIAEELGMSRNTVSFRVGRARREGWLSKAIPGKAGAGPGPKLKAWMRTHKGALE